MVRSAFEARTDTLATWGLLQKNCLLLEADKARSKSALTDRLRKAAEAREEESASAEGGEATADGHRPVIRPIRPLKKLGESDNSPRPTTSTPSPDYLQPVAPRQKRTTKTLKRLSSTQYQPQQDETERYWLKVVSSRRHIALPVEGELSLGRFDPNVGIPPDIDLAYEDRVSHLISRRHATIIGREGKHRIEDLGSRAGVFLNGQQINSGELKPNDQISLGNIQLVYEKIPDSILAKAKTKQVQHLLTVTPTGRKYKITPPKDIVIGHADIQVNFKPDIDLSREGEVARLVSRRHAMIHWRHSLPYLEDLGSGFGTRVSGEGLLLGQVVPLKPGDHIWIAGCVLAYDVE
jgi:pSer/pThr/pTyr-binding forkhead associated (FHA) protein